MPITIEGTTVEELNLDGSNVAEARFKGVRVYREAPDAPNNVLARNVRSTQFEVVWDAVEGATSYELQVRFATPGSPWSPLLPSTGTVYRFIRRLPNRTYEVRVRSVAGSHTSNWVTIAITTPS